MDRRSFFKKAALTATGVPFISKKPLFAKNVNGVKFFGVHSFIEDNPEAVFIMKTNVDEKTNGSAIYSAGKFFVDSVLIEKDENDTGAVPVDSLIAIKPNLTLRFRFKDQYTVEGTMGIVTDVNFTAALVDRLKGFGVDADKIHLIETNYSEEDLTDGGYIQFAADAGIHLNDYSDGVSAIDESKIVWKDVIGGGYFKKIPYIYPVNAENSWLLNIAKLKAHGMGITSCVKNLQGTIVKPYQQHCYPSLGYNPPSDIDDVDTGHLVENRFDLIEANYLRHKDKIPRWDKPGRSGGVWQETWATRCLDNNSVTKAGLHVVEGIYGRDGNFVNGPSLGDNNQDGLATDYMSNVIIFGKNPFHVDVIAHWIAGHEPGNFGLLHMAKERNFSKKLNPADIELYEWKDDGTATSRTLEYFNRTPLKTYYLQRDYDDQTEPYWHLCDEPYDYSATAIQEDNDRITPNNFELKQNYPNPFNPITTIEFSLKNATHVNLTLFTITGRKVATLINRQMPAGEHQYEVAVDAVNMQLSSGTYIYTLKTKEYIKSKRMTVLK